MGTLWVYIARKMRMLDFSNDAIRETLALLGCLRTDRSIRNALNLSVFPDSELPEGYLDWRIENFHRPIKSHDTLLTPSQVRIMLKEETAGQRVAWKDFSFPDYVYRGVNNFGGTDGSSDEYQIEEVGFAEPEVLHSEDPPPDSFSYWSGDDSKSGFYRYIQYEQRQNAEESEIDIDAFKL
jgi:hypothetical protein